VSDIVKGLWGKLYAWALPTALALGAAWFLVYRHTPFLQSWLHGWITLDHSEKLWVFIGLTASIAFTMNAFSRELYRILEGYLLWPQWLQTVAVLRQLRIKQQLQTQPSGAGWRRGLALEKLAQYPFDDAQVTPTRFGNALRAFETYGKTRFNLDSQTLWYELCAVAPKSLQTAIDDARSSVDFFIAMTYLNFLLGVFSLACAIYQCGPLQLVLVSIISFALGLLCQWLAIRTTGEWAAAVQALVNVSRLKFAESLGLEVPKSLTEEKKMWGLVTRYTYYARTNDGAALDQYKKKAAPKFVRCPGGDKPAAATENDGSDEDDDGPTSETI
jgi:hypothetical protein